MPVSVLEIFTRVVLPILVIVGLGVLIQRFWPMHVPTLSRLNIYLFVPTFLFMRVYESTLTGHQILGVVLGVLVPTAALGVPLWIILRRYQASGSAISALVVGGLIYNAGNFGLPLAELLYYSQRILFPGMQSQTDGPAVQALIVMMSNLLVWGGGYVIISLAHGGSVRQAMGYFRLPMIYVIITAFLLRWIKNSFFQGQEMLPVWLLYPLRQISLGLVPIALVTLGAQLAQRARWPDWRLLGPTVLLKLFGLPAVTAAAVWLMGLWPWPGAQLVIAAAAPTAINTLLLTLELQGDADTAADCVFWTTLLSPLSITAVLAGVIAAAHATVG